MDMSRRRTGVRASVIAGSVWESRMNSDEVIGGIFKAFDFEDDDNNNNSTEETEKNSVDENGKKEVPLKDGGSTVGGVAVSGKRKIWKSENFDDKNPIQIARGKTEPTEDQFRKTPVKVTRPRSDSKNSNEEQRKEINVSADGIKKSPIPTKKGRSEVVQARKGKSGSTDGNEKSSPIQVKKERSESLEGNEKTPTRVRKLRSELSKGSNELCRDGVKSGDKNESKPVQLKKAKPEPVKANSDQPHKNADAFEKHPVRLKKTESEPEKVSAHPKEENYESVEENEKTLVEIKEFGVCQEKVISSSVSNLNNDEQIDDGEEEEEETEEFHDDDEGKEGEEGEGEEEVDEEIEVEKKSIDIKEVNVIKQKPSVNDGNNRVLNEVKRFHQFHDRASPSSSTVSKLPPPVIKRATAVYSNPRKPPPSKDEFQNFPQTQNKLQSLVDLVMWRDVSRSALVFGIGTFIIISSSYTNDLNISFISVISYLGLAYLATIFVYRSVICRGLVEIDDTRYMVGEEEAVWLLRIILPYLNEFLLKLRALFSGDPATTMKLAVLLFVLARCGSSITIWKTARLGFFGVFTVPKICTSYSAQLTAYAKFWIGRFRDAWDSCSNKKAVAFAVFALVWNLSSAVARVWAVFMVFVGVRYYQQKLMVREEWREDDDGGKVGETSVQGGMRGERSQGHAVTTNNNIVIPNKLKKRC